MTNGKYIAALVALVIAIFIIMSCTYTVDVRQRAVLLHLGKIEKTDLKPGLHFKLPLVDSVLLFDGRILNLDKQINRVLTSQNKNLKVDFFVKWRIANTAKYYKATHGSERRAVTLLTQIVENDLLAQFSKRTIRQAVADERDEIMAAIKVKSNQQSKDLGLKVVDVRIKRIDLPDKVSNSVYARMRSERQKVIKALRSEGKAAARKIKTNAGRQKQVIVSGAYEKSQTIKGEGDAKATAIYANAFTQDPKFYSFYRSLKAYRKAWDNKNDLLVLRPDGEFFKYFNPPTHK